MKTPSPDAIIIGAGLSGLTTARELEKQGLDVLILEARDRPGGRTQAVEIGGVKIDLGGEWVDEAHSDIRALISSLGIGLVPTRKRKEKARWYIGGAFSDAMPLEGRDAAVYERMNEALVETAAKADPDAPWKDAPDEDVSVEEWLRREGMSEAGVHAVGTLISSCGSTVPLGRMSFYSYAVKTATRGGPGKGNEYRVEGGAGSVAAAVASELGERVRYSCPVTDVVQDGSGVEARWMSDDGPMAARARRLVMAVPFTCYRHIRFDPEPPPVFRRAISHSVYGVVRKTAFIFDGPVDPSAFTVTDTPLGYLSAAQPSPDGARAIVSFAGGEPLLAELGRSGEERERRSLRLLRRLCDAPEPVAVVEKVWAHDHFTRGSYMITAPGDMRSFGEALGGSFGKVHLAGAEGFAAAPSFMDSAVKSGLRAAGSVAEALTGGAVVEASGVGRV